MRINNRRLLLCHRATETIRPRLRVNCKASCRRCWATILSQEQQTPSGIEAVIQLAKHREILPLRVLQKMPLRERQAEKSFKGYLRRLGKVVEN